MFPHPALSNTVNVQGWSVREFKQTRPFTQGRVCFPTHLVIPSGLLHHYQIEIQESEESS